MEHVAALLSVIFHWPDLKANSLCVSAWEEPHVRQTAEELQELNKTSHGHSNSLQVFLILTGAVNDLIHKTHVKGNKKIITSMVVILS